MTRGYGYGLPAGQPAVGGGADGEQRLSWPRTGIFRRVRRLTDAICRVQRVAAELRAVGPMTRAMLMKNVVEAAERRLQ